MYYSILLVCAPGADCTHGTAMNTNCILTLEIYVRMWIRKLCRSLSITYSIKERHMYSLNFSFFKKGIELQVKMYIVDSNHNT